jgi:hypothetical protein
MFVHARRSGRTFYPQGRPRSNHYEEENHAHRWASRDDIDIATAPTLEAEGLDTLPNRGRIAPE